MTIAARKRVPLPAVTAPRRTVPRALARTSLSASAAIAALVALAALAAASCGSKDDADEPSPSTTVCSPALGAIDERGVHLSDTCGGTLALLPAVKLAGAWHGAGRDGACRVDAGVVACPAGDAGEVRITGQLPAIKASFVAATAVTVEALALEGEATLRGATAFLSNGFQSWSQSGVVALGPPTPDDVLDAALRRRGDDEVLREGKELSWGYTYVGGGASTLFAGATTASVLRPWVTASRASGDAVSVRMAAGGAGEAVPVAASATLDGETFRVELGSDLPGMLQRHAQAITSRRATVQVAAPAGWNSWYQLWDTVDEVAVRENAKRIRATLGDRAPQSGALRIVVDDGWQLAWGDWDPNTKFPSGLSGLAKDLAQDGFTMGVWMAPLLAAEKSKVFTDHPTWFLPDAVYQHAKNGAMHVLDVTNPEAAAHLAEVVTRIVSWGYGLLKIDFLFAGTYEAKRAEPMTGMQAYDRALAIIRKAAGESTILLAVGSPPVPTMAHVDGWRVGPDIALETSDVAWAYVPSQARTLAARHHLCAVTLCDADPVMLRKLARDEVDAGGFVVAFGGGGLFLSDDLRKLPDERATWGIDVVRARHAVSGVPSVPEDLFPDSPPATLSNVIVDIVTKKSSHVLPRVWRMPDGVRVGWNAGDDERTIGGVVVPGHAARVLPLRLLRLQREREPDGDQREQDRGRARRRPDVDAPPRLDLALRADARRLGRVDRPAGEDALHGPQRELPRDDAQRRRRQRERQREERDGARDAKAKERERDGDQPAQRGHDGREEDQPRPEPALLKRMPGARHARMVRPSCAPVEPVEPARPIDNSGSSRRAGDHTTPASRSTRPDAISAGSWRSTTASANASSPRARTSACRRSIPGSWYGMQVNSVAASSGAARRLAARIPAATRIDSERLGSASLTISAAFSSASQSKP